MRTLDVGCGTRKRPGAVGLDKNPRSQADIIYDLDRFPYPLKDDLFDCIYGLDVLEHVSDVFRTLEELHRVGKKGGRLFLRVPHFSSTLAFGDPTHKHFFNTQSLDYLCGGFGEYAYEAKVLFRKVKVKIHFWKLHRWDGVSFLANRFPLYYEKLFAFIFPAMNIEFELEILKP
jgi:SAM-dependent methyltransferase